MFGMSKKRTGFPGIITGYGGGTFDVDGTEVIPQIDPNEIRYTPEAQRAMDNAPRLQEGQKPKSFWQGGDKFTARDGIAGALAAVGDGFSNWANGGGGGATNMLIGGRGRAIEQAKEAQAQARAAAEAERMRQVKREEELTDYGKKRQMDQQYDVPEPQMFNIEGVGSFYGTPEQVFKAIQQVQGGGGGAPQAQGYSQLPSGFKIEGMPANGAPNSAPAPAPRVTGAAMINQQEYQRILRSFNGDQRRMNEYMRSQNISVR